jgi:hypothetical protein
MWKRKLRPRDYIVGTVRWKLYNPKMMGRLCEQMGAVEISRLGYWLWEI